MNYLSLSLRLKKIIELEIFVFGTFLIVCELLELIIVKIPSPNPLGLAILTGVGKVLIAILFIGIWLFSWYYLTKKLMGYQKAPN